MLQRDEIDQTGRHEVEKDFPEQMFLRSITEEFESDCEIVQNLLFTKVDYEELNKFLESEGQPEIFRKLCDNCLKYSKKCSPCQMMNRAMSLEDKEWLAEFWRNTKLISVEGKPRIQIEMPYKNSVREVFKPENNNYKTALGAAKRIARRLHKKNDGSLEEYIAQIEKGKSQGMLLTLSQKEISELQYRPHHYTHHGVLYKPDSISTSVRLVNNTAVLVRGAATNLNIECPAVAKFLNKLEVCIIHFLLYDVPLAADLKTAYRQILVDETTSYLRLCVWFETDDIPACSRPIVMKRETLDYGDPAAGVALEVGNRKFGGNACQFKETSDLICERPYVDNLGDSFRTVQEYNITKSDMHQAYEKIGFPVKECLSRLSADPDCLEKSGRKSDTVTMMGLVWNTRDDTTTPNLYLSRFEKKRGQPLGTPLPKDKDISVQDISRLTLSRIVPQLYDPLGGHIGIIRAQGKMLLSRSCQLADLNQLDTPLIDLDTEFGQLVFNWIVNLQ